MDEPHTIDRAKRLLQSSATQEAAQVAKRLTANNPNDSEAWSVLGAAYFELEQWEKAEDAAREVTRLNPSSARAWSNLGTVLRKRGQHEEAASAQHRALSIDAEYERAETELEKLSERKSEDEDRWRVRTPDGDFLGPYSLDELKQLVAEGEVEPGWRARKSSGRILLVEEALGVRATTDAMRQREAGSVESTNSAEAPKDQSQPKVTGVADSPSDQGPSSNMALGALVVACFSLVFWPLGFVAVYLGVRAHHEASADRSMAVVAEVMGALTSLLTVVGGLWLSAYFTQQAAARAREEQWACLSQVRQLCLAASMYSQDYDERFPGQDWNPALYPYVRSSGVWECPSRKFQVGYGMNRSVVWQPIEHVWDPSNTVLFYESLSPDNGSVYSGVTPTPSLVGGQDMVVPAGVHNGGNNFGFIDGHARWYGMPTSEANMAWSIGAE
jgi:prepilin-type processing-associated H-X9-DG protein